MKRFLIVLPLVVACAGCPSGNDTGQTTSNGSESAAMQASPADNAGAASTENTSEAPAENAAAPAGSYKVVDESNPTMPPDVQAALKKAKVSPPPADVTVPDTARVRIETSKGPIEVELNGKAAPLHVRSFLHLAKRGFFNNTKFHRYEPGFVIQGGDPLAKSPLYEKYANIPEGQPPVMGTGGPGYQIPRERNELAHEAMVIAAARSPDPDSAGSQFYFTLDRAAFLDEGEGYTVFGKVLKGEDTVLKLRKGDTIKKVTLL